MIGKYIFGVLASVVLVASAAVSTVAQVGELRGSVVMQQADGSKVPLAGAEILVVRMDLKAKYNNKTDKKGEFVFAGLPLVGQYTVAAFHPTAAPNFVGGVRVGQGVPVEIVLTPGDGKKLTEDEIKTAAAGGGGGGGRPAAGSGSSSGSGGGNSAPSAADKAKAAEIAKKNAEIEASNKKIEESNATINRTFKAGNEALNAANAASRAGSRDQAIQKFSEAVTQYDEGLAADPDQPALLTNRAAALKGRGVEIGRA